jgi:uncharacterized RDD family membrane protein YckC
MQIKVVDINEISEIGIKRSIIRELPWIIADICIFIYFCIILLLNKSSNFEDSKNSYNTLNSTISVAWMLIELITMLTNYKRRAVHDYMAKSVVVRTDS